MTDASGRRQPGARLRPGIGVRLTAWYTLTALAVLLGTSLLVLVALRALLVHDALRGARQHAQAAAALVAGVSSGLSDTGEDLVRLDLQSPALVVTGSQSGLFVQITDASGRVVNRSSNLEARHGLPVAAPGTLAQGLQPGPGGGPAVAWVSMPLHHGSTVVGGIQVAQSLASADQFQADARKVLLWADLAGAAVAACVGYLLARKALSPVRAMVAAARRIDADNLGARLPEQGPRDEIREIAEVFNAALVRIHAAVEAQRRFVAVSSHELRTPLAIIQGYAALLGRGDAVGEGQTEHASAVIRDEAARMRRMVDRLLILARGEVGERGHWERVDLAALASDVHEAMQIMTSPGRLSLEAPSPVWVAGDRERLQQVVVALVDNALKYTPGDRPVQIRVIGGDRPCLEVEDAGPGIPPEDLPRLFEPFFRGDPAHSRRTDGFGLGLSIAQLIAREHDGAIEVRSQLGGGSRFRLRLPPAGPT